MGSIGHTTGVGKRRKTSVAEVSEGNRAGGNENVAGRKGCCTRLCVQGLRLLHHAGKMGQMARTGLGRPAQQNSGSAARPSSDPECVGLCLLAARLAVLSLGWACKAELPACTTYG